jgi:hypothetical protein
LSDTSDDLLAELVARLTWDSIALATLVSNLSAEAFGLFREKAESLHDRIEKAQTTFDSLPENERLSWALANFEGPCEETTGLIREIRTAAS